MMRVALWVAIVFAGLMAMCASGAESAPDSSWQVGPRQDTLLDDGWRFVREDVAGAEAPAFDDSSWQEVTLPHTWNAEDAQSRANYYRGPGWYRKRITLKENDLARVNYLRFEGAAVVADVYMNGQKLGQHRGAFGAFCFDASPAQKFGENVIAVRVDNTKFPDIAPISGDFAIFGGIYRDVHLLSLDKRSIDPLDDASPGVYLLQQQLTPEKARVKVTVRLRNTSRSPWRATVNCTLRDAKGCEVAKSVSDTTVAPESHDEAIQTLEIDAPHLWDGHRSTGAPNPYLYLVQVSASDGNLMTDFVEQPLGLRSIRIDPDKGLFLNGKHYPLHGPNRHQDRKDKGWAISKEDHEQDFALILDMGATGVRLAHYPQADYAYSLCDKSGLLVWAEIPLVDRIAPPPSAPEFASNAKQQLRELIKQHFNHPSIIVWGISNELWMGRDNNKGSSLPRELYELAKSLDPSRPIVLADNGPPDHEFNDITDAIAFNRYYGWYVDKHTDWAGIDELHARIPTRGVGISEWGAGANPAHHEWPTKMPRHNGPWHPEEYQALLHESAWNVMKTREWLWCAFFWNMFDFATPIRQEGGFQSLNDKGVVSYDRKTKKDAFYFFKANWSDEPVVYIASRRFSPRPAGTTSIKVYSNQPAVELFVNDKSMGVLKASECPDRVFEWKGVGLPVGTCRVRATGRDEGGNSPVVDGIEWMCEAPKP
ncbi:MAG: DUF4982 domain-containing protein [Phycisphaeraceae bacterium]|nr:DUF4982 domain-containing protein [Phycisphaeraceae bacterium]